MMESYRVPPGPNSELACCQKTTNITSRARSWCSRHVHVITVHTLSSVLGSDRSRIVYLGFLATFWCRNRTPLEVCLCYHQTAKDQTKTTPSISNSTSNQILETS